MDVLSALQKQIEEEFKVKDHEFDFLYSMYGLPNFVLPLVAGFIFDKVGIRPGLAIFFTITVIGLGFQMLAGDAVNFNFMVVGYGLFGLGAESSMIALYLILVKYFTNFEFSFANGMLEVLPLCAEYSGAALIPFVYKNHGFGRALGVGFLVCTSSYIFLGIMFFLDTKADTHDRELLIRYKKRNFYDLDEDNGQRNSETFECKSLKKLDLRFWLLAFSYMLTIMAIVNSIIIASKVLEVKFHYEVEQAGFFLDIPYIIAAVLNPAIGYTVDKYLKKQRVGVILLGSLIMIAAIVIAILLPDCEKCWIAAVPPIMLGVSYSVTSVVLYPQIALTCDESITGTAYGITSVLVNIGNAFTSPAMGFIEENTQTYDHGFFWIYAMFLVIGILAFLCNLLSYKM